MSMMGKTLGNFDLEAQIGKGGMGEVFRAKDQKLGRDVAIKVLPEEFARDADHVARLQQKSDTSRTTIHQRRILVKRIYPGLLIAILAFFLGTPRSVKSFAKDPEITPEEVVAKHLKSIGKPEILEATKSRVVTGTVSFESIQGGFAPGLLNGKFLIVSERRKLGIIMRFNDFNYLGEYFAFDGHEVTVGNIEYEKKSSLGYFFTQYYGLLKEGLLGGTLSAAWSLLDVKERQPKLKYGKRKFEGRRLHELTYDPKSRIGTLELQIKLYFDFETFRHVMTECRYSYASSIRLLLREQFEDFRKVDGLMLPHRYTIYFSAESYRSSFLGPPYALPSSETTFISRWTIKAEQFLHNSKIDPLLFKARTLRSIH